jgi:DNA ligase D
VAADDLQLGIDGHEVTVSHPDKLLFATRGETKLDLIRYYEAVREPLLATMGHRPVLLQRFPHGAGGDSFFQKRVPKNAPSWLRTTTVSTPNGTESNAMVAEDVGHVAWAVNLGCLGFHVWPAHAPDVDTTDELRIDLDPSPGVTFPMVQEAASEVRALLDEHGVAGFPKTTGSRGIHVYVRLLPEQDGYAVRAAAVAVARELERRRPDLLTAAWWKEERGERVFVDFNQNAPHKTVFGAWSVRAYPEAPVSMPFRWDELDAVAPRRWTIADAPDRLEAGGDPWADMYDSPQSLAPLTALHERDMAAGLMDAPWPPVYPKQPNEPPRVAPSRAKKVDPDG